MQFSHANQNRVEHEKVQNRVVKIQNFHQATQNATPPTLLIGWKTFQLLFIQARKTKITS